MAKKSKAREWAKALSATWEGKLSASEAARNLSVSRKTFYKWEERVLQAMERALTDRPKGRPKVPEDPEKEKLREENARLRTDLILANGKLAIWKTVSTGEALKKNGKRHRKGSKNRDSGQYRNGSVAPGDLPGVRNTAI